MAEELTNTQTKRIAVVTGANKGIGLEICKQLASKGIVVVLTARDEKRGREALENFRESGLSDFVVFHQLDVVDPTSIASLTDFVKIQFGKLDILVNNAGVNGVAEDAAAVRASLISIVGVIRNIQNVSNKWAIGIFSDAENLSEERVDEVLNVFLKDFKEDSLLAKGWPAYPAYIISKAAMNAYTRVLAKKYPTFCINCVCPGYVKTDINYNTGSLSVKEGAATPVKLALLPDGAPSGFFFQHGDIIGF